MVTKKPYIPKFPSTIINNKHNVSSTGSCKDDTWGTDEEHYDKNGFLIGHAHIKWDGPFVLIRTGIYHARWYFHIPEARRIRARNLHLSKLAVNTFRKFDPDFEQQKEQ